MDYIFCRIYVLISVTSDHFPDQPGLWFPSRAAAVGDREAFGSGPGDALQPWCSCGRRQSFPLHPLCQCRPSDTTTPAESGCSAYKRSAMHIIGEGTILNTDLCFRSCRIDRGHATFRQRSKWRWLQDRACRGSTHSSSTSSSSCC